ncbi:MAG: methyltransferase domain-containing protein [Janthinobacterium lividum]
MTATPDFRARSPATELMDTEPVAAEDFRRCLADLATVNRVTLAHRPTLAFLARATRAHPPGPAGISVLDVAYGHGDMTRAIRRWCDRRGLPATLSGIDLNPHSATAARAATPAAMRIDYRTGDVFDAAPDPRPDYVVSSLFTHHLPDADVVRFVQWMERTARLGWFVNDLHRHRLPYEGFRILSRTMRWHRFVQHDGPVSITRAFVPADWTRLLAAAGTPDAEVRRVAPWRLCVARLR